MHHTEHTVHKTQSALALLPFGVIGAAEVPLLLQSENYSGTSTGVGLLRPRCTTWKYILPQTAWFRYNSTVIDEVNRPVMSLSVILPDSH